LVNLVPVNHVQHVLYQAKGCGGDLFRH